jgi:zinc and cadmium transporter
MLPFLLMILVIIAGSALSLIGGSILFLARKRRTKAILIALPFGAGALLAAAFLDLLPESFEMGDPRALLLWALAGFTTFFLLERLAGWFHHHHEHDTHEHRHSSQNVMLMIGDLLHNCIDGIAIGAAFLANPATGVVTTLAVSAHEVPKELGTFGILLSRGWADRKVLFMNVLTAVGTLIAATITYALASAVHFPVAELLAITAGIFIYIAASDIIPEIHERPRHEGNLQATMLIIGMIVLGSIISLAPHGHHEDDAACLAPAASCESTHAH